MSDEWEYQIRFALSEEAAELAHERPDDARLAPLNAVLARHRVTISSQFDAFAGYCAEAERNGVENYPLYRWTRATIDDPAKKAKHRKIFTCSIDGAEVYARDKAEALEADLTPLVGGGAVEKVNKYDTNPANNPQAPAHLQG